MPISVDLITPERRFFYEPAAESLLVPTAQGQIGVFVGHVPLIALLGVGELRVRKADAEESIAVYGGIVRIGCDQVTLLADSAEFAYDLDYESCYLARLAAEADFQSRPSPETRYALRCAALRERLARRALTSALPRLYTPPPSANGLPRIAPLVPRASFEPDVPEKPFIKED
ncbi:MAG: ATP synthase F1 subunit epsilon [Chloroflexota bacterium]|jgi:F-type H+-transporting ATPase subunit epsilon|nr:MAG: ATP synthase F1 subunit epsilon [Chloroflexota bacterium]